MNQALVYVDPNSNVTIDAKPEVHHSTFIKFKKDGAVVGTIKATFDFSDMPPDLHGWGLQIVQGMGTSVYLALDDPPEQVAPPKPTKTTRWKRWFG